MEISYNDGLGNRVSVNWGLVVSETGITHLFSRRNWAAGMERDRALCGFHIINPPAEAIPGKVCAFCVAEAKLPPSKRTPQGA